MKSLLITNDLVSWICSLMEKKKEKTQTNNFNILVFVCCPPQVCCPNELFLFEFDCSPEPPNVDDLEKRLASLRRV